MENNPFMFETTRIWVHDFSIWPQVVNITSLFLGKDLTQAAQAADQLRMGWLDEMINQLCGTKSNSLKFFESFKVFFSPPPKKIGFFPTDHLSRVPSGKLTFCYGKSPFLMGKSTISMVMFHCYVSSPEGISYLENDHPSPLKDDEMSTFFVLALEDHCLGWTAWKPESRMDVCMGKNKRNDV